MIAILYGYWYFGPCGFLAISWILLSIIIPLSNFIKFTVYVILPCLSI